MVNIFQNQLKRGCTNDKYEEMLKIASINYDKSNKSYRTGVNMER